MLQLETQKTQELREETACLETLGAFLEETEGAEVRQT
jgi:hypothetical protein